jgi:hypothetical protein
MNCSDDAEVEGPFEGLAYQGNCPGAAKTLPLLEKFSQSNPCRKSNTRTFR